jgi:hypothetical protein
MAHKKVPQSLKPSLYLNPHRMMVLNDCAGALEGIADALRDHDQVGALGNALGIIYITMTDVLEEVAALKCEARQGGGH